MEQIAEIRRLLKCIRTAANSAPHEVAKLAGLVEKQLRMLKDKGSAEVPTPEQETAVSESTPE